MAEATTHTRSGRSDDELDELTLARARRGDRSAHGALVTCYADRVYALVGRMLANRVGGDLVDDVAQEALVKALRGVARFETDGGARLSTWVLTIATRCAIDVLRRERAQGARAERGGAGASATASDSPEQRVALRQLGRHVERAMAQLPADQRAVLVLRAYHDFDYDEIAGALEIERGTVKSRLSRARAALREAIDHDRPRS